MNFNLQTRIGVALSGEAAYLRTLDEEKHHQKMKTKQQLDQTLLEAVPKLEGTIQHVKSPTEFKKKSSLSLADVSLLANSLNRLEEDTAEYNNGYDRDADAFTSDAKRRYIDADKAFYAKTKQNMSIHSGKRTVQRQAELYIQYKWHGQGNPASWPGCSFHNWGLAADMVRIDEANIVAAMNANGWTRTVADEGWHFECTGSGDHAKAASKIKAFRKSGTGLAYRWSEQVAFFYLKTRDFNKRAPIFNRRLEAHRAVAQALQVDIDQFNQDVTNLQNRVDKYNRDANHFNNELARANRLYEEIINMPDGPAKNQKIREYNALAAWLNSESDRLDRESKAIDRENNRLANESASLDARIKAFQQEDAWLNKEFSELSKLEKEIPKHESNANNLLGQIDSTVP